MKRFSLALRVLAGIGLTALFLAAIWHLLRDSEFYPWITN